MIVELGNEGVSEWSKSDCDWLRFLLNWIAKWTLSWDQKTGHLGSSWTILGVLFYAYDFIFDGGFSGLRLSFAFYLKSYFACWSSPESE